MGSTTITPEPDRVGALIARLDPREGEPCRVAGCVHAHADEQPLAA